MNKLKRAQKKLMEYQFGKYKRWGGVLTPTDVKVLLEAGYKPVDYTLIQWVLERLSKGKSNPIWIYFQRYE